MNTEQTIHAAVTRCTNAWTKALAAYAKQENEIFDPLYISDYASDYAGQAYRNALPYLTSPVQIDAFIACVAHGLALGAIDEKSAAKLLYAAQVAITSRKSQVQAQLQTRVSVAKTTPTPTPSEPTNPAESTPIQPADSHATNSANAAISANSTANPTPSPSQPTTPAEDGCPRPGVPTNGSMSAGWGSLALGNREPNPTPPTPSPSRLITPATSTPPTPANSAISANPAICANSATSPTRKSPEIQAAEAILLRYLAKKSA